MITCIVCGSKKPDGPRWIDVAGGQYVCSVECEKRRVQKLIAKLYGIEISNKPGRGCFVIVNGTERPATKEDIGLLFGL